MMKIDIYSLNDRVNNMSIGCTPGYVFDNISREGYITLLGVYKEDGEDEFAGILQMFLDITTSGVAFGRLVYMFVDENVRGQNVGTKLLQEASDLLKSNDIDFFMIDIPHDDEGMVISDISENEIKNFFKECGFASVNDKRHDKELLFKLTAK